MVEKKIERLRAPHPDQELVDARAAHLLRRSARVLPVSAVKASGESGQGAAPGTPPERPERAGGEEDTG